MISKATFKFLKDLQANNNRDWFKANKDRYDAARAEFEVFITKLHSEIVKFDDSIGLIEPKKTIFRIYRDVRFSKNKDPYKTNFGAHIHPGDKQALHSVAGYYIHIEPGGKSMLAGGAYLPQGPWLKAIRQEIDYNGKEFKKILNAKSFKNYFNLEGEKLKRPPKGYDADHPDIELLKLKSFIAVNHPTDKLVESADFLKHCKKAFKVLYPFDQFLNPALD